MWVHFECLLPPDKPDHADGATITTPVKKPVAMRCATLVRVIEVLPVPMSSHSIVAGGCIEVHRALLVREQLRGVSMNHPTAAPWHLRFGCRPCRCGCGSSICQVMAPFGVLRFSRPSTTRVGVSLGRRRASKHVALVSPVAQTAKAGSLDPAFGWRC